MLMQQPQLQCCCVILNFVPLECNNYKEELMQKSNNQHICDTMHFSALLSFLDDPIQSSKMSSGCRMQHSGCWGINMLF